MRRILILVIAVTVLTTGFAYAQWSYQSERGGTTTIFKPEGSWFSYGTRPDGSTFTDFQPDGSWFINRQETGGQRRGTHRSGGATGRNLSLPSPVATVAGELSTPTRNIMPLHHTCGYPLVRILPRSREEKMLYR